MTDRSGKKKIAMFVDDDNFIVSMYSSKFVESNFETHAYLSAKDALDALRTGLNPDVIISDIRMPLMDGYEFLKTVKSEALSPQSVKVMLTNQSTDEERKQATESGADYYLVKAEVIPSDVVSMVEEIIAKRSAV